MPELSIITINLNNSTGLRATIESVIDQDFTGIEYIIIDGGSSDDSIELIHKYQEKISFWISEKDRGIYNAMNKGIMNASGKYLLFLNSGDILAGNDVIRNLFDNNIFEDIIYGDLVINKEDMREIHKFPDRVDFRYFLSGTIGHPSTLFRRSLFEKAGLYNENLRIVADWEFFIRSILLHKSSYRHISIPVSVFSMDGTSSSALSTEIILSEKKGVIEKLYPPFVIDLYNHPELFESKIASFYNLLCRWKPVRFILKGLIKVVFLFRKSFQRSIRIASTGYKRILERLIQSKYADHTKIPVIINNFNRLAHLKLLITWLEQHGFTNIFIIDNCSTYPPLLNYYDHEYKYKIFKLKDNSGHLALWNNKDIFNKFSKDFYIYTDPDVVPVEECPSDFIDYFMGLLRKYPDVCKVGFSLKIDDLPDRYSRKEEVTKWESQNFQHEIEQGVYRASIDTTFALYRPREKGDWRVKALRTGFPYQARHLPWYEDDSNPGEEDIFYLKTKLSSVGHWSQ